MQRQEQGLPQPKEQQQYQDSVWYYKKGAFKEFVLTIADKTVTLESAIRGFRELTCISKLFREMKVQEIVNQPQLIERLYEELRANMPPAKSFKLPYKKTAREMELKENLAQLYDIDRSRAKAKIITGYFDGDGIVFPYAIEAIIAPRKDWRDKYEPGELEFVGCINDSPAIDGGEKYFSDGNYVWEDKKTVRLRTATSAREILQGCGFDTYHFYDSKKRVPCVFLINLLTPVPEWYGAAGKTHINLRPYTKDIAELISYLAYQMPTCHGMGLTQISYSTGGYPKDEDQVAIEYLRRFLKKRKATVKSDPFLKTKDRITQSGVWYRIRPQMKARGFNPPESWTQTRRTLQTSISDTIEWLWPGENLTREDLGIVASSKGVVLYDGEAWPINGDTADALAEKGIAIIVIEKEGVADILAEHARKYGIALAHTGGRFTNAIKKLIERAKEGGSVVRVLTDYDAVGMDIAAATTTPTIRIGIERDIVKWLQEHGHPELEEKDVEEEYAPSGTTIEIKDEYLRTKRIELDSIQEKVGGEKLWEYIMYRLQLPEFNTGFDLTKVIEMPTTERLYPQLVKEILQRVENHISRITRQKEEQILAELKNVKELTEISAREFEIEEELVDKVLDAAQYDEGMKAIIAEFKRLLEPGVLPDLS